MVKQNDAAINDDVKSVNGESGPAIAFRVHCDTCVFRYYNTCVLRPKCTLQLSCNSLQLN